MSSQRSLPVTLIIELSNPSFDRMHSVLLAEPPPWLPIYRHGNFSPGEMPSTSLFCPNTPFLLTMNILSTEISPEPTIFIYACVPFCYRKVCPLASRGGKNQCLLFEESMKVVDNTLLQRPLTWLLSGSQLTVPSSRAVRLLYWRPFRTLPASHLWRYSVSSRAGKGH